MSEEDETWMEKSMHGQFVLFTDHQAALAEKERELDRAKIQVANFQRWLSNGVYYTNAEYEEQVRKPKLKLQADLYQVVGEAVKFAELYTNAGVRKRFLCFNEHYHEAMCFLTSPQVQAWRKGKEGKG